MPAMPSATWQMLDNRSSGEPLPRGLDAVWDAGAGIISKLSPRYKKLYQQTEKVLSLEEHYSQQTDLRLRESADKLRETFRCGRENPADIEHAFALVREIAFRKLGEKPFPVQITGALALEHGYIAEMATGEGKTLTSTMYVTIAGWRGQGCHVITVNDYLAKRDAEWMGQIYRFCGLSVAYIEQQTEPAQRKAAYMADITYCTNKEVTADFLRDRLTLGNITGLSSALLERISGKNSRITDRLIQRRLNCAIVDEADSVLIDESVTPLIISGNAPNPQQVDSFQQASEIASQLISDKDYKINHRYRDVELTEKGREHIDELTEDLGGIWKGARRTLELVNQALIAKELYHRDQHYVIHEGKVVIVDEFTGRLMPDRTWRDGMHQAVEAKEAMEINPPKDTYARISFQRFFRMYRKLSGMTGTAAEAASEFWQIYHLPVVKIPTNRPCLRETLPDAVLTTKEAKWERIVQEIKYIHEQGRPVLVGTRSVFASEYISKLLNEENLEHQVLNAVYHNKEAQIVAEAGQPGKITVATNMAGRGTDIKLGRGVAEMGGLYVIAAEPNESARIDRQLFGRCARQGDPGTVRRIFSLEDEIITRYAKTTTSLLKKRYALSKGDISSGFVQHVFKLAQSRAEKMALSRRKTVLRTDHWLDEQLGFAGKE
ncbi:MAG: preprotein translocase subunit SecA [Sedimentisphaerales bacterium]|nr:preprotein translocase subunit SecA [Sedimentisphaerales bacterium]